MATRPTSKKVLKCFKFLHRSWTGSLVCPYQVLLSILDWGLDPFILGTHIIYILGSRPSPPPVRSPVKQGHQYEGHLKLRGLRFHPPRLCRLAVFLIHTNVSLWKRSWTGSWIPRTARRQSGSSIDLDRLSIYRSRRYVVTLLGPLMAVNCSRRYVVTLLGPWLDGLWQSPVWGHLTWTVARRLIAVTGMGSFDLDR